MLESFLVAGRQDLRPGGELRYGQSITDGCIGWETTVEVLDGSGRLRARSQRRPSADGAALSGCGSRSSASG